MKLKLMEGNKLAKLIGAIGAARVTLDVQVQLACMQVIGQSIVHRNTTPANSLLEAVSKHHKATIVVYLEKFGNFQWDRKSETLKFRESFPDGDLDKAVEAIGDAKWYDAKKPPVVTSEYDALKVIGDVIDRLLKKASKGATITNKDVLTKTHAAYCAAVAEHYNTPEHQIVTAVPSKQNDRVDEAAGRVAAGAAKLAEHFGKAPELQAAVG